MWVRPGMNRLNIIASIVAVFFAIFVGAGPQAARGNGGDLAAARHLVVLHTDRGPHRFFVEIADTPAARGRGLMFRPHMASDHGMLFDFSADGEVTMWMHNTPLSLDMIFVRFDGTVHRIARSTTPYSQKIIASKGPVRAVLEVLAGTARRIGLKPGDRLDHPMFTNRP